MLRKAYPWPMTAYCLNEQDRARLYFVQEHIKDRIIINKKSSEELRLIATIVMEICRILSKIEKD